MQKRHTRLRPAPTILNLLIPFALAASGSLSRAGDPAEPDNLFSSLRAFAGNVIEHARDRYGPKNTPLFVCQLDLDTKELPPADSKLYRTDSRGGAGPAMNNLEFDSALIRFLDAMTAATGDPAYTAAVDEYLAYYLEHLPEQKTGFFPWGDHRGYDVVADRIVGGPHEFKCTLPPWQRLFAIRPEAVKTEIEGLRQHIYDESKSLAFSRHYPSGKSIPHSMNSSGFAWIAAWTFLAKATADEKYAAWAREMVDYFASLRNPHTHLLAAHPYDPAYPATLKDKRSMLRASRTEYMGQITFLTANLLHAADLATGPDAEQFRKEALTYYHAFIDRMDIRPDGSFYATFDLESGEPLYPRIADAWSYIPQVNETHTWANTILGIRAPASMAFGFLKTRDPALREAFEKLMPLWRVEEFAEPSGERKPLPAGLIAQAIQAFLNMHRATGEDGYISHATTFASYAARHYLTGDGWIVCGPSKLERYNDPELNAWRMYSNRGGSDDLALALLKYWLTVTGKPDTLVADPLCCW